MFVASLKRPKKPINGSKGLVLKYALHPVHTSTLSTSFCLLALQLWGEFGAYQGSKFPRIGGFWGLDQVEQKKLVCKQWPYLGGNLFQIKSISQVLLLTKSRIFDTKLDFGEKIKVG